MMSSRLLFLFVFLFDFVKIVVDCFFLLFISSITVPVQSFSSLQFRGLYYIYYELS